MNLYNHIVTNHLEKIKSVMPNWKTHLVGVFLYGSQNYNADTEFSDVDTKAIYVPTLQQLTTEHPDKATTYSLDNGEKCELMSITHFVNNLYKQNINFVEVIFTEHFWLNPRYKPLWDMYFTNKREDIARYDVKKTRLSSCGQALHTLSQYKNAKKIGEVQRVLWFLEKYKAEKPYLECITLNEEERKFVVECKENPNMSFSIEYLGSLKTRLDEEWASAFALKKEIDKECKTFLNLSIQHFVKRGLMYEETHF